MKSLRLAVCEDKIEEQQYENAGDQRQDRPSFRLLRDGKIRRKLSVCDNASGIPLLDIYADFP